MRGRLQNPLHRPSLLSFARPADRRELHGRVPGPAVRRAERHPEDSQVNYFCSIITVINNFAFFMKEFTFITSDKKNYM